MRRRLGYLLTIAGLLIIGGATLAPLPRQAAASALTSPWCLVCGDYGGVDVIGNALLFIPLGLGVGLLGLSIGRVAALGFVISVLVESLQLTVIPGRDASLSDLLTNTAGAALGAALSCGLDLLLNPGKREAGRLALLAGLFWLGIQAGTGFLLRPWIPAEELRGAWARIRPGHTPFDGEVTSAFVSGSEVGDDSRQADPLLRRRLLRGEVHLALRFVSGRNILGWSPIFELEAGGGPVLGVQGIGRDIAFQVPARSYGLRLRRPMLLLASALPSEPGKSLELEAGEERGVLWATWRTAEGRYHSSIELSPSLGWSLVLPFEYAYGPGLRFLTALWVGGLLFPVGYWSVRANGRRYLVPAALVALLATGLGLIPLLGGYPAVHWSEWLAGVAGLAAGWVSLRFAAYLGWRCDSPSTKEFCLS
jgi:hypothetical protein